LPRITEISDDSVIDLVDHERNGTESDEVVEEFSELNGMNRVKSVCDPTHCSLRIGRVGNGSRFLLVTHNECVWLLQRKT